MKPGEKEELLGVPSTAIDEFITRRGNERQQVPQGRPFELLPADEVILFLLFFRHYLTHCVLGSIFNVSKKTAYNTTDKMMDWFYAILKTELTFHSLEWRLDHGGTQFFYQLFTLAIDG